MKGGISSYWVPRPPRDGQVPGGESGGRIEVLGASKRESYWMKKLRLLLSPAIRTNKMKNDN